MPTQSYLDQALRLLRRMSIRASDVAALLDTHLRTSALPELMQLSRQPFETREDSEVVARRIVQWVDSAPGLHTLLDPTAQATAPYPPHAASPGDNTRSVTPDNVARARARDKQAEYTQQRGDLLRNTVVEVHAQLEQALELRHGEPSSDAPRADAP